MRILHTCHTYWPHADGVSVVMQRISEGLASRGHDVTVATGPGAGPACEVRNGVTIRRFRIAGNEALGYEGETDAFTQFVTSAPADVVLAYAAQICTTDLLLPLAATLPAATVLAACGYSGLHDRRYAGYFAALPRYLHAFDAVVYHSGGYQDAAFAARHGLTNGVVIANGADPPPEPPEPGRFRDAYGIGERRVLLSVGRVEANKGQDVVLQALAASRITDTAAVFVCPEVSRFAAGALRTPAGPLYRPRWEARALARRVAARLPGGSASRLSWRLPNGNAVYVLAGLPRQDVLAAYGDADLFVFGSRVECAPLVVLEAMAAGLPFVSTPVGNVPELAGGVLVNGADEMAAAVHRLVRRGDEWERLARAGREAWARDHCWEHIVGRYESLYERLTRERPARGRPGAAAG